MSTFQYGPIAITVESLKKAGDWEEYGVRVEAPGIGPSAFRIWYPEERDHRLVAQVIIYDLIEAYEDPQRFVKRKDQWAKVPRDEFSAEGTRNFLRAAIELAPFLHEAHVAVYKDWSLKPLKSDKAISRGPREWMPYKKRN